MMVQNRDMGNHSFSHVHIYATVRIFDSYLEDKAISKGTDHQLTQMRQYGLVPA